MSNQHSRRSALPVTCPTGTTAEYHAMPRVRLHGCVHGCCMVACAAVACRTRLSPPGCSAIAVICFDPVMSFFTICCFARLYLPMSVCVRWCACVRAHVCVRARVRPISFAPAVRAFTCVYARVGACSSCHCEGHSAYAVGALERAAQRSAAQSLECVHAHGELGRHEEERTRRVKEHTLQQEALQ